MLLIEVMGQNGWTRKAKSYYGQITFSSFQSSDYYSTENKLFDQGATFNSNGAIMYVEYGILDRLNTIVNIPLLVLNSFSTTETVLGMGSAKLGLKYRLFKNAPISLQVDAEIPANDGENFATSKEANILGFKEQINLPTSDGETNVWTSLAASKSFQEDKTFASIYGSVNYRTQNFSDQFVTGIEIGHLFISKFYLIGKLRAFGQIKSSTQKNRKSGSFLYGEGTTFTEFTFIGIYKINKNLSIHGGYANFADFIIERGNIYSGRTLSLGISFEH